MAELKTGVCQHCGEDIHEMEPGLWIHTELELHRCLAETCAEPSTTIKRKPQESCWQFSDRAYAELHRCPTCNEFRPDLSQPCNHCGELDGDKK